MVAMTVARYTDPVHIIVCNSFNNGDPANYDTYHSAEPIQLESGNWSDGFSISIAEATQYTMVADAYSARKTLMEKYIGFNMHVASYSRKDLFELKLKGPQDEKC